MKVLVITRRGLHLGYVGCYGNDWVATPHLDRLAAEGVVFDRHYADCPGLSWTGRCPFPVAADVSLPKVSPVAGLSPFSSPQTDAVAALDLLENDAQPFMWLNLPSLEPPWEIANDYLEAYFVERSAEDDEETGEPLAPWLDPPTGLVNLDDTALHRLQLTYAAAMTSFDDQLGELLEGLQERGLVDEVLVCVTADQGLALGEHGVIGPGRPWLHDELVHLPLILRLPEAAEGGRRVGALTQPMDLVPTLLAVLHRPVPPEVQGRDLWPLIHGRAENVRDYACTGLRSGDRIEWALRTRDWAYLLPVQAAPDDPPRPPQLYVKPDDRWEVNNVLHHHLERADRLEQTLRGFVAVTRRPGPLVPPELRESEAELRTAPAAEK